MRTFGPDDASRLTYVDEAGFVPASETIYYCVSGVDGDRPRRELSLFDRGSGLARTPSGAFTDPRDPRPSPDGARLAFRADVDGTTQICVLGLEDDVVEVLTELPQGVAGGPDWSPDGRTIAFTARPDLPRDRSLPYRVDRTTFRFEGVGLIDDAVADLHVVDVATRAVRRLASQRSIIEDPRWSPDGRRILFRVSFPPDEEWAAKPSAHVIDVETGEQRVVVGEWGAVFDADWCPDGEHIVFYGTTTVPGTPDVYFHKHDVWTVGAGGGTPVCRTEDLRAGVGVWLEFDHPTWHAYGFQARLRVDRAGGAAYVQAQRGGDVTICRIDLSREPGGETAVEVAAEGRAHFLSAVSPSGAALLYVASTLTSPPELFLREGDTERRITHLNDEVVHDVAMPQARKLDVTAPDGLRLDAWALTPPGPGPFPTVLAIHGGPGDAYGNVFMSDHHQLVGAGIAVVFSNFRGSGGYGTEFAQRIGFRWGERGEPDHLATIDRAVELGIADPGRLGVYGLSHGGFATCWLLGRTDRFRAGVAENPVTNWFTEIGTMDAPWWIDTLLGRPEDDPTLAAETSPLTYAPGCTAPLLFILGDDDLRCPATEAEQYYRVLRRRGVPTEMLRLPGSDHLGSWLGPVPARAAQNEALVEWFTRHLLGDRLNRVQPDDERAS